MTTSAIRDLQGILDRCKVDDITGCWVWAGPYSGGKWPVPMAHVPSGVFAETRLTMSAYKVGWLLSGRKIREGNVVYRKCLNAKCVNPQHCATGTQAEMHGFISATGKNKGLAHRSAVNRQNASKQALPVETVREIEQMLEADVMVKTIAEQFGITKDTIRSIKRGQHVHARNAQKVARNASIFTLGMAA